MLIRDFRSRKRSSRLVDWNRPACGVFRWRQRKAAHCLRSGEGHFAPLPSGGIEWKSQKGSENEDVFIYLPHFATDKLTQCAKDQGIQLNVVSGECSAKSCRGKDLFSETRSCGFQRISLRSRRQRTKRRVLPKSGRPLQPQKNRVRMVRTALHSYSRAIVCVRRLPRRSAFLVKLHVAFF